MTEDGRSPDEGRIPFRLRIGVIGHRELRDEAAVRERVRTLLQEIRARFPPTDTTGVGFSVLSALAEGADRLVAEQAMADLADADVELHAVLPLQVDSYLEDFRTVQSRDAFKHLLAVAAERTQVPVANGRDAAYEVAGRFIVDHSDLVIAVWDGHPPQGRGGTADTVAYAERRSVPLLVVPAARTSRADASPEDVPTTPVRALALPAAAEAYRRTQELNARSTRADTGLRAAIEDLRTPLVALVEGSPLRDRLTAVAAWAVPRFARADRLAMLYQRRYNQISDGLYLLAALAVTAVAAQHEAGLSPKFALLEVAFMLAILGLFYAGRRYYVRERWIEYRSLAEAFRSALFIVVARADELRDDESRLAVAGGDQRWFQRTFSEAWRHRPPVETGEIDTGALRHLLGDGWAASQARYHRAACARFLRTRSRLTWSILTLFALTIVCGILHAWEPFGAEFWPKLFVFLAIALPAFGAALAGIRDQHHYRVHEDRSDATADRLEQVEAHLTTATDLSAVQRLAVQIQKDIAAENIEWSTVVEFQELEVVV